jgi:hypothetical protein
MDKPMIKDVWCRVKSFQGQEFHTKTGKPFTYSVSGDVLNPSRTEYNLSKRDFEKALALVPLEGPSQINQLVRGPAYIWAVLHDPRVRRTDW